MKANAPEKIYLEAIYPDNGVLPNGLNYTPSPTDIEYIRTEAFVEKACEKLEKCMYDNLMFQGRLHRKEVIEAFIEDFKKSMEE